MQHAVEEERPRREDEPLPSFYDDERVLLTQPLLNSEVLPRLVSTFRANDFHHYFHAKVFRAYEVIEEREKEVDWMTIHAVMRELEIDTPTTQSELGEMVYGIPSLPYSSKSIQQSIERVHRASDERMALRLLNKATTAIRNHEDLAAELTFLEEAFDSLRLRRRRRRRASSRSKTWARRCGRSTRCTSAGRRPPSPRASRNSTSTCRSVCTAPIRAYTSSATSVAWAEFFGLPRLRGGNSFVPSRLCSTGYVLCPWRNLGLFVQSGPGP